ncbi:MAG: glycine cleavage system aminomethyltransferase GcvT [Nitrospinales bacterium]
MPQDSPLKTTPLFDLHRQLGAKMAPFAGWNMPIQYRGVIQEHLAVRNGVGLFDVSHMGEIEIRGDDAEALLQRLITNDIRKMNDRSILYTLMCYENGGVVDDLLVHRFSQNHYFLCVNASNADKDFQWITSNAGASRSKILNLSDETAQLAVQGERAEPLLQGLCDVPLNDIQYYHFKTGKIQQIDCVIARTGYTGEDGFEIYLASARAEEVCRAILQAGEAYTLQPVGLGARDTLRLEMGYALYGHEIDAQSSPLEAGLGWVIKLNKDFFIGQEALRKQKAAGLARKTAGIKLLERGVPREHYRVMRDGRCVGGITSGTYSPSLQTGIALARIAADCAVPGAEVQVEIRNRLAPAVVTPLPFVPSHVKKS